MKVGHWDANIVNKVNKPVQLNSLNAIEWTGEFWQELQCLAWRKPDRDKGTRPLEGKVITVVTIEVCGMSLITLWLHKFMIESVYARR